MLIKKMKIKAANLFVIEKASNVPDRNGCAGRRGKNGVWGMT
jgi:hypothetical protein